MHVMLRLTHRLPLRQQKQHQQFFRRAFCQSVRREEDVRGLIYSERGDPRTIVRGHRWPMPERQKDHLLLRVALSSVNPADINVIQGVYPAKPRPVKLDGETETVFVGGNEGYAVVEELPESGRAGDLQQGDWVVFAQPQMGTWKSHLTCKPDDVIKIERNVNGETAQQTPLTDVMASTLQVNPATAYRMLHDFVTLDPQTDAVIQNTANSAVGQLVAQMCSRKLNIPSINLVRDRPDLSQLVRTFHGYGKSEETKAHVFTYEDFGDKSKGVREEIQKRMGERKFRLGLNALCGKENEKMVKMLSAAEKPTLVTYGAESRQPLSVPAGLVIFYDLQLRSFMMNRWYGVHSLQERREMMQTLVEWYEQRIIEPPPHTIVEFKRDELPEDMTRKAREAITNSMGEKQGKKIFFRFA